MHAAETGGDDAQYGDAGNIRTPNDSPTFRQHGVDINTLVSNASTDQGWGRPGGGSEIFRIQYPGLNVDHMSYCLFVLAGRNANALLDAETLTKHIQRVYSTFFQHFASMNNTLSHGGRVFQPIGQRLPSDLTPIVNMTGVYQNATPQAVAYRDKDVPYYSDGTTTAIVHRQIYNLEMSLTAVIICLIVFICLTLITLIVYGPYANQFKRLPRDVETLASIIALVHDSTRLRAWMEEHGKVTSGQTTATRITTTEEGEVDEKSGMRHRPKKGNGFDTQNARVGLGHLNGAYGPAFGIELEPVEASKA